MFVFWGVLSQLLFCGLVYSGGCFTLCCRGRQTYNSWGSTGRTAVGLHRVDFASLSVYSSFRRLRSQGDLSVKPCEKWGHIPVKMYRLGRMAQSSARCWFVNDTKVRVSWGYFIDHSMVFQFLWGDHKHNSPTRGSFNITARAVVVNYKSVCIAYFCVGLVNVICWTFSINSLVIGHAFIFTGLCVVGHV